LLFISGIFVKEKLIFVCCTSFDELTPNEKEIKTEVEGEENFFRRNLDKGANGDR
jgi:hypothetical protein